MNIYVLSIAFMPLLQRKLSSYMYVLDKDSSVALSETKAAHDLPLLRKREALPVQGPKKLNQGLKLGLRSYSEEAAAGKSVSCCFFALSAWVQFYSSALCIVLCLLSDVGWILMLKLLIVCEIVHLTSSFWPNYNPFFLLLYWNIIDR